MTGQTVQAIRFGASWSTQFRFTQAIGRGLSDLTPIRATVVIGQSGVAQLESRELDLVYSKSVNNEHLFTGKGLYAKAGPAAWLRTIAWLPQEDRFLFAVAPWTGIESFEDIVTKKPPLKMAGGAAAPVLKEYGFSYADIVSWGGSVRPMEHTAREARARHDSGELDACFGDGSAYDFTAWTWMAQQGYRFLDVRPDVMERLEQHGLRRNITPAGFLPGISRTLLALDDSHIVVTCHQELDDNLAYHLAKAIRPAQAGDRVRLHPDRLRGDRPAAPRPAQVLVVPDRPHRASVGPAGAGRAAPSRCGTLLPRAGRAVAPDPGPVDPRRGPPRTPMPSRDRCLYRRGPFPPW